MPAKKAKARAKALRKPKKLDAQKTLKQPGGVPYIPIKMTNVS